MAQTQTVRPISPHLSVYRWQVQMVTSILHRATGVALSVGLLVVTWGLLSLAYSSHAWAIFAACAGSIIGIILLIGWSWSFFYHLCNGVRHLLQDAGMGFAIKYHGRHNINQTQFVTSSWLSIIVSLILTLVAWLWIWHGGVL